MEYPFLTKQNRKTIDFLLIEVNDNIVSRVTGKIGKNGYSRISLNPGSKENVKKAIDEIVNEFILLGYSKTEKPKNFRTESQTFDKAKWHFNGNYPKELDLLQAYVHTGFFIAWLILKDKYDKEFIKENQVIVKSLIEKENTPCQIYIEQFDGVFSDEGLDDFIVEFINYYFDFDKGNYLKDYEKCFANEIQEKTLYVVIDNWFNYEKIAKVIDKNYSIWINSKKKSNWKFWKKSL